MRSIVTGGAGFIGSHLVDRLLHEGHAVTVIDDFSSGKEERLAEAKKNPQLTIVKEDIRNDLSPIFEKDHYDVIFHVAARPRVQYSIENPLLTQEINEIATVKLLECARKHNVPRFVFSSSSSVYGNQKTLPLREDMPTNPMSPYAIQKQTSERYCKVYRDIHGLETVCLRYFNVYGPRMDPEGGYAMLIPKFALMISEDESPPIRGSGSQTRDFTFVDDVVEANIKAAKTKKRACFGGVFNIGTGHNISVKEVVAQINKGLGKNVQPHHVAAVYEPRHTLADIFKARTLLGWKPNVSFEEGIERVLAEYK